MLKMFGTFFKATHEFARSLANGLAVSQKFYRVHAPLAALAARDEQGRFLHCLGDFALVKTRVLASLAQQPEKKFVFASVNGLRNNPHLPAEKCVLSQRER